MKRITSERLIPGMVTAEDVYALSGQLLVPKDVALTDSLIRQLQLYSVRSVRIDDTKKEESPKKEKEEPIMGSDIPGFVSKLPDEVRKVRAERIREYKQAFDTGVNYFQVTINNLVSKNTTLDVHTVLDQTMALIGKKHTDTSVLEMLIYMKEYDSSVYAHSINVSLLCNMLARWLEYSEEDCKMAAACGMFHDIGKLAIPDEIIQKPGPLTPEERAIINTHAEKGYHMLEEWHVNETVKLSALMHHERCDGSGYPHKLKGSQIDRFAKLVTICDIYNAMTSDRSYRKAMSPFDVIEHFEEEGLRKFDTRSILVFLENTVNTYLNCPVRLNNGAVGYVVFINRNRLGRPIIQCGTEFIDLSKRHDLHVVELLPVV